MSRKPPKNFEWEAFDSPGAPGSGRRHMAKKTLKKLGRARKLAGVPFIITSAYRTPSYNTEIGGVEGSAHTNGRAVDISIKGMPWARVVLILVALVLGGFRRIGLAKSFVHADDDPDKPKNDYGIATWDYMDDERHKA
ncbi:D-Ala-D-Ala carboxypeptidase family metallohydrolase [Thiohalorhabdus sp.]|uniref:D-Ala-D-Ala carboxypeptidase family metallohydrolase n=1 Tax=Thiohalorhabdus sp. TaxID=3094134 RepID=UPI002FC3BE7B